MAFGTPVVNSAHSNTTTSPYTPSVASVTAGRILLCMAYATRAVSVTPTDISLTDTSGSPLTWTPVFSVQPVSDNGATRSKTQWWWAVSDGNAKTLSLASASATAVGAEIIDFSIGAGNVPDFTTNQASAEATTGTSTTTDPVVTLPTTPGASDLGILMMIGQGGGALTAITGWTTLTRTAVNSRTGLWAYDTSSPAQSVTWTTNGNPAACMTLVGVIEAAAGGGSTGVLATSGAGAASFQGKANSKTTWSSAGFGDFSSAVGKALAKGTLKVKAYPQYEDYNDSGSVPDGWSQKWVTSNITYTESSGNLRATTATADGRHGLSWDEIGNVADIYILTKIRADRKTLNDVPWQIIARGSGAAGSETAYALRMQNTGTDQLRLTKYAAGAVTALLDVGFTFAINTDYYVRFELVGTSIKAKAWSTAVVEPTSYNINTTDSAISAAGWAGYMFFTFGINCDTGFFAYSLTGPPSINPLFVSSLSTKGSVSAVGSCTVAWTSSSAGRGNLSSVGVAGGSLVGRGLLKGNAAASGVGTASFAGIGRLTGNILAQGQGLASFQSKTNKGNWSMGGTCAVSWVGLFSGSSGADKPAFKVAFRAQYSRSGNPVGVTEVNPDG